jgi:ubiquinone biosynthesis accessory factor UbiK
METKFLDPDALEALAKRFSALLPEGAVGLRQDLERNFRAVVQSGLGKLDLVTRREFDVQAGVLKRTREKLEVLERQLAELEAAIAAQRSSSRAVETRPR